MSPLRSHNGCAPETVEEPVPMKETIAVKIKFMGDLRAVVGKRDLTMNLPQGSTIGDLLTCLSNLYGEPFSRWVFTQAGDLHHYILIFMNGRNIREAGELAVKLEESEVEIIMLPMFEGG